MSAARARRVGAADAAWREHEAALLLTWAAGSVAPEGGFGWRLRHGGLDVARGRQLWICCRMVHCLSLGALLGRADDARLAARGVADIATAYRDPDFGGWVPDADWPDRGRKEAYGHAFVILAGSTSTVAGITGGADLLEQALHEVRARFWDEGARMPYESYARDFSDLEDYRGGNAAMHLVEAFLAAADATGDSLWRARALDICERMLTAARECGWRVPEHFDAEWRVRRDYHADDPRHPFRPYGVTPGHAFEWARLVLTLAASHPVPGWFTEAARMLAETAWSDAWDPHVGGLAYTTDFDGAPVVRERFHWVACEALGAFWALDQVDPDGPWVDRYDLMSRFVQDHLVDVARPGAWWHELDEANRPIEQTWVGAPDVYHALQAVLLPSYRLEPGLAMAIKESAPAPGHAVDPLAARPS